MDRDSRIVEQWQKGTSIRRLADELNEDIITSELNAANVRYVEWSRTPVYEALHRDELSDVEEIEIHGN